MKEKVVIVDPNKEQLDKVEEVFKIDKLKLNGRQYKENCIATTAVSFIKTKNIDNTTKLTFLEEQELGKKIKNGDTEAADILLLRNIGLVQNLVSKMYNGNYEYDDLIAEGIIGLKQAISRYDWVLGYKFSTYASYWIISSIKKYKLENSKTSLPTNKIYLLTKIKKVRNKLVQDLMHEPSVSELSSYLNIPVDELNNLFSLDQKVTSFNSLIGDEDDVEFGDIYYDQTIDNDNCETVLANKQIIDNLMSILDEREALIITLKYGLYGNKENSIKSISEKLGIPQAKINMIQNKALRKFKNAVNSISSNMQDSNEFIESGIPYHVLGLIKKPK